jgi:hypothetical protein
MAGIRTQVDASTADGFQEVNYLRGSRMKPFQCCLLPLFLVLRIAEAQQKPVVQKPPQPPNPPPPIVNCSEAKTAKACGSFKQLLDAHDKDILDSLSRRPTYVCLRPNEDAFLIFHVEPPSPYGWRTAEDGVSQTQESKSSANLTEYRDGVFYTIKDVRAPWYRSSADSDPLFHSESTEGMFKGLKVTIYPTEIFIGYPFDNQSDGTNTYSLTIRRSTGRFVETLETESRTVAHLGSCFVYR